MTRAEILKIAKETGKSEYQVLVELNAKGSWWEEAKRLFKKDKGGVIDESDPEYSAQKIYGHWLNSFK